MIIAAITVRNAAARTRRGKGAAPGQEGGWGDVGTGRHAVWCRGRLLCLPEKGKVGNVGIQTGSIRQRWELRADTGVCPYGWKRKL